MSIASWMEDRLGGREPSRAIARVIEVLRDDPESAAYSSAQAVATVAGVNVATATRAAQFLGYPGWPALVRDVRAHYLASLTSGRMYRDGVELGGGAAPELIEGDARSLRRLAELPSTGRVGEAARMVAAARSCVILTTGMYTVPASVLVHGGQMLGYDVVLASGSSSSQINAVRRLTPADLLVAFDIRSTASLVSALTRDAGERGVPTLVVADRDTRIAATATLALKVPLDAARFVTSMTAPVALMQAVLSALANLDPERSQAQLTDYDERLAHYGVTG